MQNKPWSSMVGWLIAFGVPMTPLAGTWIGYLAIGAALVIATWRGWVWVSQQNWRPGPVRFVLLVPSVLLAFVAAILSYYGGLQALMVSHGRANSQIPITSAISINCSPESLPIPGKQPDSLFAVFLHPNWGDEVVKHIYGSNVSNWPEQPPFGVAYRCAITNTGTVNLANISLPLRVDFRSERRGQRSRTIEVGLWTDLDAKQQSILHIADDSGWDPKVTLPEFAHGRVSGERRQVAIPIEYPTRNGEPLHIAGFGVQ